MTVESTVCTVSDGSSNKIMKSRKALGQFVRFGMVGVFCTGLHYAIYYMLQWWLEVNLAYTAGYVLSFVANFYLTAFFTFGTSPSWKRLAGMGGAHLVNYLLHMLLLNLFLWLDVTKTWAPVPVFAIAIPVNFILVRWVFTNHKNKK